MPPLKRTLRIELAYDGTDFAGWQIQPGRRTVQGVLETALARLSNAAGRVRVRGAGRTDAGAHARRQVADARIASRLDDAQLLRALAALLPRDLRPTTVRTVPEGFDARRQARSKTYHYRLDRTRWGDPLLARYAWHRPGALDARRLQGGLALLPGRRDWSGFAASACVVRDRVRRLDEACFDDGEHEARFTFTAEGFLTHMVRNLVGTLVEVARGRMPVERVREILERGDRGLAGPTAPAHGLCLVHVDYGSPAGGRRGELG